MESSFKNVVNVFKVGTGHCIYRHSINEKISEFFQAIQKRNHLGFEVVTAI